MNFENTSIFLQADLSIGIEPLFRICLNSQCNCKIDEEDNVKFDHFYILIVF